MGLETGTYISDLVVTNPTSSDPKSAGDNHLRLVKSTIKNTFPNVTGAVNPTPTEFNALVGVTSSVQAQINAEIAARTAADTAEATARANADTTETNARITADNAEAITRANADTAEATARAAADTALLNNFANYAPLSSPVLTGTPTAPTASAGTSTTQIATTSFVVSQAFSASLPGQTGNAGKFVTTNGTAALWADAVTPSAIQTLTSKTIADPKITLSGSNGLTGQVMTSQGAGISPIWQTPVGFTYASLLKSL